MVWGHGHRVPFEDQPEEGTTERQLRQLVADLRRDKIRLEEHIAVLEGELAHMRRQAERPWWRRSGGNG